MLSCNRVGPEPIEGQFIATIVQTESDNAAYTQATWSAGDRIVLSGSAGAVLFEDGEPVISDNVECFTLTPEMISSDGLTIGFDPTIMTSKSYVMLAAKDFNGISSLEADGTVEFEALEVRTELNYVSTAVSADGKFALNGVNDIYRIDVYDKRIAYVDVSAGYSFFEIEVDKVPVSYYLPLPHDEDLSDGLYAYAYDTGCDKMFSGHFTDIDPIPNKVCSLGAFIDPAVMDAGLFREILTDNDEIEATYNLEGEILKRYLDEVHYDDDYSYTRIKDYVPKSNEKASVRPAYIEFTGIKNAKKIYLISEDCEILTRKVTNYEKQAVYNLIPGRTYRYGVVSVDTVSGEETLLKKGRIATEGRLRVIKTNYMHNARDIGGWEGLDGKHIKYGILIRSGEIIDSDGNVTKYEQVDYESLVDQVGINYDLDFRNEDEAAYLKKSPFGLEFLRIPLSAYDSIVAKKDRQPAFKKAILQFIKNAKAGKCTFVHCQGGADRTGTYIFYIEGLLGVSDSDLCKDYEITSFYYHKERNDPERYLPMIKALQRQYGTDISIGEAIYKSARSMGITDQDIEDLRSLMLE